MIIDLILDRKDGKPYNAREFYFNVLAYGDVGICIAMDYGEEKDVKRELCRYLKNNGYNLTIGRYIYEKNWLCCEDCYR